MTLQQSIQSTINNQVGNGRYINDFKHSIYNSGNNLLVCENRGKKRLKLGFFPISKDILEMENQVLTLISAKK